MKLTLAAAIAFSLLASCCFGVIPSSEVIEKCIKDWTLNMPPGNDYEEKHCSHIRHMSQCYGLETSDSHAVVDDMRFILEQESRFQEKYHFCDPDNDRSKLTKLVKASGMKAKYSPNIVDFDDPEPCALKVYKKCLQKYYEVFQNKMVCADFSLFISCLTEDTKENERGNQKPCEAEILTHLRFIYAVVGNDVVKQLKKTMPRECDLN